MTPMTEIIDVLKRKHEEVNSILKGLMILTTENLKVRDQCHFTFCDEEHQ